MGFCNYTFGMTDGDELWAVHGGEISIKKFHLLMNETG
jgi:hypothetical protein